MNKAWILCSACMLISAGLMAWGFSEPSTPPGGTRRYAVLMAGDKGTDVMQFKQGAQTAAEELDATLHFMTASQTGDLAEPLLALIDEAVKLPVDGLILPPCGEDALTYAPERTHALGIGQVVLGNAALKDTVHVVTDYRRQGELLRESALSYITGELPTPVVFAEEGIAEDLMLEGIASGVFSNAPVYRCKPEDDIQAILDALSGECILFTLNPWLTECVALAENLRFPLFGVDPGDSRVSLLREGLVAALVMEMPYAQGYLSVVAAAQSMGSGEKYLYSPGRVVTAETMYASENVKLMFPLLQ